MAAPMCKFLPKNSRSLLYCSYVNHGRRLLKQPYFALRFYCANNGKPTDDNCSRSPFWQNVSQRTDQASRSVLIRLSGRTTEESLLQYCTSHGKIQHYFTYTQQHARYALVEFKAQDGVDLILDRAYASNKGRQIQSRFLSFTSSGRADKGATSPGQQVNKDCSFAELYEKLAEADSVSHQLDILVAEQELRDPEIRLRFLVCSLIEEAFHKILPSCSLHLFGSSINGFGRRSCDMDMFLERNTEHGIVPMKRGKDVYKLRYDPTSAQSERAAAQSTLFALASFLEKRVPHCMAVIRILQATCPLVKFRHHATGLSCDLTADNSISLKSSELLHVFSQLDPRVRPLVFMIRHWSRYHGITNRSSGKWITNFPLTLLVVFFLQTRSQPVLPSFAYLRSLADDSEQTIIDGTDCTVSGDLTKVQSSQNTQTTAELLQEFFNFCTTFNFDSNSLSIRLGKPSRKQDHTSPLHMENPFQTERNMCKNVSHGIIEEIQKHSQYALHMMDVPGFQGPRTVSDAIHPWGIGALLAPLQARKNGSRSVLGSVLKGLSRKAQKNKNSNASNNTKVSTSDSKPTLSNLDEFSAVTCRGDGVYVASTTALDASLHTSATMTWENDPCVIQTSKSDNATDSSDLEISQDLTESVNSETMHSQAGSRTQVPKLRISLNNVKNRLFEDRKQSITKGIVQ